MRNMFSKKLSVLLNIQLAINCLIMSVNAQTDLPKIIQPSPTTAALFRFEDYPMDYSTGLPQISVPIYEVISGSLSVPISISYHASGRKVYDQDGPIAVGWGLNAGGTIARTIYGSADFGTLSTGTYKFPYPFKIDNLTNLNDLIYLQKIIHFDGYSTIPEASGNPTANVQPWLDSEFDIFSYSFNNKGGKFIFKDSNNIKTPVLLPFQPYKITPTYNNTGLTKVDITDDKGILYQFVSGETYSANNNSATSSWVLSKMISVDKSDTISFIYTTGSEERVTVNQTITLIDSWTMQGESFPTENSTSSENTSHEFYQTSRLTEIVFKQGKILFNVVSGSDKIDNIQIRNLSNDVLKTIQFNRSICYSQSELGYATNKLDALIFKDRAGSSIENYAFEYYPLSSSNGQLNVRYCDWWGYYNNSGVHDFVPRYNNLQYVGSGGPGTIDIGNPSVNRNPNLTALQSGILKKITYPTGGSTEFIYENNKCTLYGSVGTPINGPGLRVYQIKATESTGISNIKTYKYGMNESGYGSIELLPDITAMATEIRIGFISLINFWPDRKGAYRQRTFNSDFIGELSALANKPVIYTEVNEYNGTETVNTGKSVYNYDYNSWASSAMPVFSPTTIVKKHIGDFNYWNNPSLVLRTDYKNTGSNSYLKIKETASNYAVNIIEYVKGLHVQRVYSVPQAGIGGPNNHYSEQFVLNEGAGSPFGLPSTPIYTFDDYQITVGSKNLTNTSETLYTDNNTSINNGIAYQYNSSQLVSKTTATSSEGNSIITDVKYPFDYTGNSLLTQMVSLNMLNYPVEQIETKSLLPTKSVRTNYFNWGTFPARIAPQTVELKVGSGNYKTRLRYSAYDIDGNSQTVSKENDMLISYIWGYNNTYPIADITNAAVKNVFHTSFEDADGNSVLNDCKTGRRSRTGGYSKSLSNLDNGDYILSNWQKSGGNWVLQYLPVSVTAGTYTISLTGQMDEIRFYPKASLMKTYTYDPLIGIITACDASDFVSYYEYDNYGRLKSIRDMNGNILKTIRYQHQGTIPN